MWKAIYRTDTGELVSIGTVVSDQLTFGMASRDLGETAPDLEVVVWDQTTTSFKEKTITKKLVQREEFIGMFTDTEFDNILAAANVNSTISGFIKKLDYATTVNLLSPKTIDAVNALESAGLLAVGRASEVLA